MGEGLSDIELRAIVLASFSQDTAIQSMVINPRSLSAHLVIVTDYAPGEMEFV